jgi:hypothetical protein
MSPFCWVIDALDKFLRSLALDYQKEICDRRQKGHDLVEQNNAMLEHEAVYSMAVFQ